MEKVVIENTKYENRHWEQNTINNHGNPIYELHFKEYYDDKEILRFVRDEENDEWMYSSDFLNVEHDVIVADSVEEAMKTFEEMIVEHIQEEISCLEERLGKFNELYKYTNR